MRFLMEGLIATALVLMLCISGCTSPTPTAQPSLTGVTWYLIDFNKLSEQLGPGSLSVLPGTTITAFFDAQGTVSGSAGCNQYTAPYQATLNSLSVGAAATTMMFCDQPAGIMTQESLYLTTLQEGKGYTRTGDLLTVTDSGGRAILTYSTVPPQEMTPASLTGTMWYLNSLVDVQGQIWSPRTGNPISVQFANDGTVSGNAGCNRYSGTYTVTGNSISISGFAVTLMFCGEPGVMDIESTYLAILPMMKVYRISGNELTLSDGTGRITMIYDITT